jgi:quercetin dioxygenase-like cupin family protein
MKHIRSGDVATVVAPAEDFVGTVLQNPIVRADPPGRVVAVAVTFLPGARTNWHHHPLGQTLHVTAGCGWFQTRGEPRVTIRAGDTVTIPPGEVHWLGATDTTMMTHIAIQEREGEVMVTWLDPVADDDYLART